MELIDDNHKDKDPELWRIAKERAEFKQSLFTYLIVNGFLWLIWFFTDGDFYSGIPWPVWPMIGWGFGVGWQFYEAYYGSEKDMAEREYDKLKGKRN